MRARTHLYINTDGHVRLPDDVAEAENVGAGAGVPKVGGGTRALVDADLTSEATFPSCILCVHMCVRMHLCSHICMRACIAGLGTWLADGALTGGTGGCTCV